MCIFNCVYGVIRRAVGAPRVSRKAPVWWETQLFLIFFIQQPQSDSLKRQLYPFQSFQRVLV